MDRENRAIKKRLTEALEQDGSRPVLSASNISFEMAEKNQAISNGGIGLIHLLAKEIKLTEYIDDNVHVLKQHKPYHESDHVLNIPYNILCGVG